MYAELSVAIDSAGDGDLAGAGCRARTPFPQACIIDGPKPRLTGLTGGSEEDGSRTSRIVASESASSESCAEGSCDRAVYAAEEESVDER